MVPSTPNGELARILRELVEKDNHDGLKFKIVETGGVTVKSRLQKSNPSVSPGCSDNTCVRGEIVGKGIYNTVWNVACVMRRVLPYILARPVVICS